MNEQRDRLVNLAGALARLEDAGYALSRATTGLNADGDEDNFRTPLRLAGELVAVRQRLADIRSELAVYVGVYS